MTDESAKREQENIVPDPLADIELSREVEDRLLLETVGETIVGALAAFTGLGKLYEFLGSYSEKMDKARLLLLLNKFRSMHKDNEAFNTAIKKLIVTPAGINLLQKVIRIANANAVDISYIQSLATVLKSISDSDFESLFEEHNYVLSQIEKLTPQALLLLSDYSNWPGITFASTTTSGVTSGKGWDTSFATLYSNRKRTPDEKTRARLTHVINELRNNNLIGLEPNYLPLTAVGAEVYKYLQ